MRSAITLAGNLGADVELRYSPNGTPVATFSVGVGSRKKEGEGWTDGPTSWYRITAFKQLAEDCTEKLSKGSKVIVAGFLEVEEWTDKEGQKRNTTKVLAEEIGVSVRQSKAQREAQPQQSDPWVTSSTDTAPF